MGLTSGSLNAGVALGGSCSRNPSNSYRLFIDASMISTDSSMSMSGGGSLGGGGGGVSDISESRLVLDSDVPSGGVGSSNFSSKPK